MNKFIITFLAAFLCLFSFVTNAYADLLISPLQVVMEGRDRSTQIILVNTGNARNTYRIQWTQFEQISPSGAYAATEDPAAQTYLQDIAVFTPRQISLSPKEKQTVRLAVRRPADLPDGEYKSHIKFQIVSSERLVAPEKRRLGENQFGAQAQVVSSYSIPAVYRVGDYDCQVSIGTPRFEVNENTGKVIVYVPLERKGIHGAIGLIEVYHTPNGGQETKINAVGNVNVFPEISSRDVRVLTNLDRIAPGTMRIVYKKAEGERKDYVTMAEQSFPVQ